MTTALDVVDEQEALGALVVMVGDRVIYEGYSWGLALDAYDMHKDNPSSRARLLRVIETTEGFKPGG